MTNKQQLQNLIHSLFVCIVCDKPGGFLCELHAADERTECQRQKHVEVII